MKSTITGILAAATAFAIAGPASAQQAEVSVEVVEQADGTRTLVHEAVIEAPVAQVWAALSTADGWKMWGPKAAWFDFRTGGTIETSYVEGAKPGDGQNIVHRILAFVPERMIALQVEKVPDGAFEPGALEDMWGVYELEPVGDDQTRLRISGVGYRSDETSSRILEFFKSGNVYSIQLLEKNLAAAKN